jgi:hypothetical protein
MKLNSKKTIAIPISASHTTRTIIILAS